LLLILDVSYFVTTSFLPSFFLIFDFFKFISLNELFLSIFPLFCFLTIVISFFTVKMTEGNFYKRNVIFSILFLPIFCFDALNIKLNVQGFNFHHAGIPFQSLTNSIFKEMRSDDYHNYVNQTATPLPPNETVFNADLNNFLSVSEGPVLFILVESLGVYESQPAYDLFKENFSQRISTHNLEYGTRHVPHGSTITAEFRELCGLYSHSYQFFVNDNGKSCLPKKFAKTHWKFSCIHPASGVMFNRNRNWTKLGCQTTYFSTSPAFQDLSDRRSAFLYKDELQILDIIAETDLDHSDFYYLLTVAGHFPHENPLNNDEIREFQKCDARNLPREICALMAPHSALVKRIYQILEAHPNLTVFGVGDHPVKNVVVNGNLLHRENQVWFFKFEPKIDE